jgi:hypothetical protein
MLLDYILVHEIYERRCAIEGKSCQQRVNANKETMQRRCHGFCAIEKNACQEGSNAVV